MGEGRVCGRLLEIGIEVLRVARIVTDEMQVLAIGRDNAERLLYQAIGLIPSPVTIFLARTRSRVGIFGRALPRLRLLTRRARNSDRSSNPVLNIMVAPLCACGCARVRTSQHTPTLSNPSSSSLRMTTSFPIHLPVRQEATGNATCTPRLAVSPAAHASFIFVPHKHGPGPYRQALLVGQAALHAREQAETTGLEEDNRVCRRAHLAIVGFHYGGLTIRNCVLSGGASCDMMNKD